MWCVSVAASAQGTDAVSAAAGAAADSAQAGAGPGALGPLLLAIAVLLGVWATRRGWLRLAGCPGLQWTAAPLHLMAMALAAWMAGGAATIVAARALGIPGPIDPSALSVRDASVVAACALSAGLAVAVTTLVVLRRGRVLPPAPTTPTRAVRLGLIGLVAWWPALASAGWLAGMAQEAATGVAPPAIGHDTLGQMVDGARDGWWWLMGATAVLLAPVLEECVYRGFLQQAMRRAGVGPWASILVVSGLFTMMHLGSVPPDARAASLSSLAVLSCCFGWLAERTGTLAAPIAAHVAFNLANLGVAMLSATPSSPQGP